jgi:hypothetical protein
MNMMSVVQYLTVTTTTTKVEHGNRRQRKNTLKATTYAASEINDCIEIQSGIEEAGKTSPQASLAVGS